jgi:hypothetical protein
MDSIKLKLPNIKLYNDPFIIDLNIYGRQYMAVNSPNNEKLVLINLFCDPENHEWKKIYVDVMDGGACYIQVLINITQMKVIDFGVNNPA